MIWIYLFAIFSYLLQLLSIYDAPRLMNKCNTVAWWIEYAFWKTSYELNSGVFIYLYPMICWFFKVLFQTFLNLIIGNIISCRTHNAKGDQLFITKLYGPYAYRPQYGLSAEEEQGSQENLTSDRNLYGDSPWPARNAPCFNILNAFMERCGNYMNVGWSKAYGANFLADDLLGEMFCTLPCFHVYNVQEVWKLGQHSMLWVPHWTETVWVCCCHPTKHETTTPFFTVLSQCMILVMLFYCDFH